MADITGEHLADITGEHLADITGEHLADITGDIVRGQQPFQRSVARSSVEINSLTSICSDLFIYQA